MGKGTIAEIKQPEVAGCRHHWLIETPRGATSKGVCKLCGAAKEFRNSADSYWDEEALADLGSSRWGRSSPAKLVPDDEQMAMSPRDEAKEPAKFL